MDNNILSTLARLSDAELLARVKSLATRERDATAHLVAHLAELDTRDAYLREGTARCSSTAATSSACRRARRTTGSRSPAPRDGSRHSRDARGRRRSSDGRTTAGTALDGRE